MTDGAATITLTGLPPGTRTLRARFLGTGSTAPATGTTTVRIPAS